MYLVSPCIGSNKLVCDDFFLSLTKESMVAFGRANYKPKRSQTSQQISQTDTSRTYTDNFSFKDNATLSFENITIEHRIASYKNINGFLGMGYNSTNPHCLLNTVFTALNSSKIFYINTRRLEVGIGEYPTEIKELKSKANVLYRTCHMIKGSDTEYACNANGAYFKSAAQNEYVYYDINNISIICSVHKITNFINIILVVNHNLCIENFFNT